VEVSTRPEDVAETAADPTPAASGRVRPRRFLWVREAALILAFYYVYQTIRSLANSGNVTTRAFRNARHLVALERNLHIFVEQPIQQFFLSARWLIRILNVYYGTLHFVITAGLLVWVYHYRHAAYRRMRNLLGITTALALIGYWTFPLAPPRLQLEPPRFVDTLDTIGGLWSYNSPVAKAVANPFAAMPSLHFGWALWCGMVFWTLTSHRTTRALAFLYPFLTLAAIVITANHYFLDAVGGAIIFGAALLIQAAWDRHVVRRRERRDPPEEISTPPPDAPVEQLGGVSTG
jgi:hypothetical protein